MRVHAMLEGYLRDGTPLNLMTDEGECAQAGAHLLPPPGAPGMLVEEPFILEGWGHRFLGLKDITFPFAQPWPIVADHKTTSDFKWAKTEFQLYQNIQAVLYAAHAMIVSGKQVCELRWIYYKSRKPWKAKLVQTVVTQEQITPTLERIKTLADEIQLVKSVPGIKAKDLPYNPNVCEKYGGCPYIELCALTPMERMLAKMTQEEEAKKNAFLASIRAKTQTTGGNGNVMNPPTHSPAAPGLPPGVPPGSQISPDGQHFYNGSAWVPIASVAPAAPPPPPPPPPPAQAPPPPPPPPAAPTGLAGVPQGAQISPDGKYYYSDTGWVAIPAQPIAAPVQAPKRRGRPPKNPPAPGAPLPPPATGDEALADAYEGLAEAYLDAAKALRGQ